MIAKWIVQLRPKGSERRAMKSSKGPVDAKQKRMGRCEGEKGSKEKDFCSVFFVNPHTKTHRKRTQKDY